MLRVGPIVDNHIVCSSVASAVVGDVVESHMSLGMRAR